MFLKISLNENVLSVKKTQPAENVMGTKPL